MVNLGYAPEPDNSDEASGFFLLYYRAQRAGAAIAGLVPKLLRSVSMLSA